MVRKVRRAQIKHLAVKPGACFYGAGKSVA